jgi:hypothetical protein
VFVLTVVASQQALGVNTPTSDPPTPRSQAANRTTQQRDQDLAARAKERKIRKQEHLDRHNEDYRLHEQQDLSPPPGLVNSSSDEEESEGERTTSDRWEAMAPPSPGVEGVIAELTLEAGAEPPVIGSLSEALAGIGEAPPEPSRKRK